MGKEIERKFLVKGDAFKSLAKGARYRQGYLSRVMERVVRIRIIGDKGFLAVKGKTVGAARMEYEYEIPAKDAEAMLYALCEKPIIEKNRYKIPLGELVWEIDEFFGENEGLVLAEVELQSEDQPVAKPEWVGVEVTGDPKYFNVNLVRGPYKNWRQPQ